MSGVIESGILRVERLDADVPDAAGDLVLDLYRRLPEARITDILKEVDGHPQKLDDLRRATAVEARVSERSRRIGVIQFLF